MRANAIPRNEKCFPLSGLRLEDDEYACVVSAFSFPCFRWCHFLKRPYRLYGLLETRNSRFERQIPLSSGIRRLEFEKLVGKIVRCTNRWSVKDTMTMLIVRILRCSKDRTELSRINEKFANHVQDIIFLQFHLFFYRNVKTDRFYSSRFLNSTSLAVNSFCGN